MPFPTMLTLCRRLLSTVVMMSCGLWLAACGGGDSTVLLDRIDFGNTDSETAHALNSSETSAVAGVGALSQSYRQPKLATWNTTPTAAQKITFTVAVDPDKQNYLTVKLWGSDTQFGVLRLDGTTGDDALAQQLDNNNSAGSGNPPFYGRFHYATTALPMAMTAGKTSVTVSLYSTGYYYDVGPVGNPTRPIYSAFTHVSPYFGPPAGEQTGTAPVQVGTEPPAMVTKADVYRVLKRSRANIYNLDGVPDGFWNGGGTLKRWASVIPAGTTGAPPEVIGMAYGEGKELTPADIAAINALPNAADAWRDGVAGRQMGPLSTLTAVYLAPPLTDENGTVVPGYDRYLDPAFLDRIVGILDGMARSQNFENGGLSNWDNECTGQRRWGGVTSSARTTGPWAGSKLRKSGGCVSFDVVSPIGRTVLNLLDHPQAAQAFKAKLAEQIDADLDGKLVTRAAMYQRMLAASKGWMGFASAAVTSTDQNVKFGGTAAQAMIFVGNTYPAQLALRQMLASYPNADADKQPMDAATLRTIVRQLIGLEDMTFMRPATPGWRLITKGGLSETYGSLSAGYDGRYGGGVPSEVGKFATLMKYDSSMSATDKAQATDMARKTISSFNNFLYPQHRISFKSDGSVVDTYALGQEDVISWRVPYGPNANGWNLNLQTLAVDPDGAIQSPQARRSFLINAGRSKDTLISDYPFYLENEAAWKSIADADPSTVPQLPGEPGAPDFVWADVDSGALALARGGERLFMNLNYNRAKGGVNHYARIHHVTDTVDREATIRMPFNVATIQDDGNLTGGVDQAWVVRYGRYLVVMNRGITAYNVNIQQGYSAYKLVAKTNVAGGATESVAPGTYEVYYLSGSATANTVPDPAPEPTNVALGKTAGQSSLAYGGDAKRALDGNTDGVYNDGSVTHTDLSDQPWWQVDLTTMQDIQSVKVYNRTDCCTDRLSNFYVLTSPTDMTGRALADLLADTTVTQSFFATAQAVTDVPVNASGRFVRVQLAGRDQLSLAEVQVIGVPTPAPNIAKGKPASQSSTDFDGAASRAVDGNTDGAYSNASVTHTWGGWNNWWQVDLQANHDLSKVTLFNRTDCCADRLHNFFVFVSATDMTGQTPDQLLQNAAVSRVYFANVSSVTEIARALRGRYVRVQLTDQQPLSLAEVKIEGVKVTP